MTLETRTIGQLATLADSAIAFDDRIPIFDTSESNLPNRTKAILPAALRRFFQGGVDVQRGGSTPTTRSDGGSLVGGDRWWDTVESRWWFWNGTYWLSEQINALHSGFGAIQASASVLPAGIAINPAGNDIFWLNFVATFNLVSGSVDGTNNWQMRVIRRGGGEVADSTITFNSGSSGTFYTFENNINAHRDVSALDIRIIRLDLIRVGTAPQLQHWTTGTAYFRWAKP